MQRELDEATERATAFAAEHAGKLAELDSAGLAAAMRELAAINELVGKAGLVRLAAVRHRHRRPRARGAAAAGPGARHRDRDQAAVLRARVGGAARRRAPTSCWPTTGWTSARHYLRSARRYRPHLLTEPEEKILAEKSIASQSAWSRLFGEQVAALRVQSGDEELSLEVALSRLQSPDRDSAARHRRGGDRRRWRPGLRTRAFIYNTLLHDKAVEDRLRSYPHWLASRNLANEASDESVMALIEAVRGRFDIPQRWYRLKAQLLGVDQARRLRPRRPGAARGRHASRSARRASWCSTPTTSFSPDAGRITRRFFDERWIDAPVRPHKRGGAFCAYTVPSVHPYVMLNFTARRRDVLTMAHELGHGLHAALAQPQGVFQQSTPLTLAETASVFGEALVFGRMLEAAPDDDARLSLLAERIDGAVATVFRQMAMNRFEHLVHTRRRDEGELSVRALRRVLASSPRPSCSATRCEITDGYRSWWSYVPHFINTPGYVYAYAYGQLLALSVYGRYLEEGPSFAPRYLELLAAGGSRSPEELGAIVGIDLADPGFWDAGLRAGRGSS